MSTHGASLPAGTGRGQDRWATTPHGIVLLDGATAVEPGTPPADDYVDALSDALCNRLDATTDLADVIAGSIRAVSKLLDLRPGEGPSSTVALLRHRGTSTDVAVLGDSTIVLGRQDGTEVRLSDERLKTVGAATRQQIHDRLRAGTAYDAAHRDLLTDLQVAERGARNAPGGYWIAEADHTAGHHADVHTYPSGELRWAVLTTDGAQRPVDHLAITWSSIATMDDRGLAELLHELHQWESAHDPDGRALPRAKPHDDKTVVTWTSYPADG